MRRISVTFFVLLALGASLLPGGAAHAAKKALRDATGDVLVYNIDTGEESPSSTANGDIKKAVIRHTSRAVVVTVKFRSLQRKGEFRGDRLRIVTNEKVKRDLAVIAWPGFWGGQAMMFKPKGNEVECNVKHRIKYGKNLVKIAVPRSCLSDPRWVRVGVESFWFENDTQAHVDDARRDGKVAENPKLSGRVRRG